jgi:folate-binding Fe-S cluster repair protein YgfZ
MILFTATNMIVRRIYRRQIHSASEVSAAASNVRPKWAPNDWPKSALIRTHLQTRRMLEISGSDAGTFLQGLISNDIRRNDELLYTGFLTHKGRYLFDAFLWRDEQNAKWRLDVADSAFDTVLQHIKRYRLRSKVELEDISDRVRIENFTCPDPNLSQQLRRDLISSCPGSQAYIDPRSHAIGIRCCLSSDHLPQFDLLHAFANIPEPDSYYDAWQIMNGVPRHGYELLPDRTIPLEANL